MVRNPHATEATSLQQCVRARAFADSPLQRATEVATPPPPPREARLAAFADLPHRITDHTVGALRGGGRADLPDDLRRLPNASSRYSPPDGMSEAQSEADAASKAANLASRSGPARKRGPPVYWRSAPTWSASTRRRFPQPVRHG